MKFGKKSLSFVNSMVNNVYFLYIVAFIALIDVLGYIMRREFSAVLFFYLIGMIAFYYTKNMSIVLLSAILGTSILHVIRNLLGFKEGMKHGKKNGKKHRKKHREGMDHREDTGEDTREDEEEVEGTDRDEEDIPDIKEKRSSTLEKEEEEEEEESFTFEEPASKESKKAGYQNKIKLKPGMYNIPSKDAITKQLGEADKMEKAYDNLEKIVGEKGFKSVSNTTKDLIAQQDKLLKGLKDITPSINEAMSSIGKIDFDKLGGIFNSGK